MALSAAVEDAVLAWLLGSAFPQPPKEAWLALHRDATPTADNEIKGWAGGDRLRVSAAEFGAAQSDAAGGLRRSNSRALLFGLHSTDQTVRSFGLWDAAKNGKLLISGTVGPDAVIVAGNPAVFLTGDLSLQVV